MKSTEAAMLCRYVAACCPQQKFDEYTPDAWFDLLGDLPFDLAKLAAAEVAKRQPFVSPSEIRGALSRMRASVRKALREKTMRERMAAADEDAGGLAEEYDPTEWLERTRRREREDAERVDAVIRGRGADFNAVNVCQEDPDGWMNAAPLILSVIDSLPAIGS